MRQRQVAVGDTRLGESGDGVGERLARVIARAVVGDDDLGGITAIGEIVGACCEARRDAASLVIGRKDQ
jgi:hypothetical protein